MIVGTKTEFDEFLEAISPLLVDGYARLISKSEQVKDAKGEQEAHDIVLRDALRGLACQMCER